MQIIHYTIVYLILTISSFLITFNSAQSKDTYRNFSKIIIKVEDKKKIETIIAYNKFYDLNPKFAKFKLILNDEICIGKMVMRSQSSFKFMCSSGYSAKGVYYPTNNAVDAFGRGADSNGKKLLFRLEGLNNSLKNNFTNMVKTFTSSDYKNKQIVSEQKKEQEQLKPKIVVAKKSKSEFSLKPIPINFPSVSVKRDDIAVIIGNANYKKQGKDIPNVNPAYADAEGIKKYFMKAKGIKEGNIIYLKDATGSQLLGVFGNEKSFKGKLFNYIKPNKSNVYIYYAGHGAPGEEGDAYLVPTDSDAQTIEFTGYPLSTLYSNLGKLPVKSMTVILEACFSGGSQSGSLIFKASPIVIQPKKTFIPNNIKVIAAGSERQMASWEEDSSHSLFTKYFLKAMSGEGDTNNDGKVSDKELREYLSDTMTYYARRYYGRDQKVQIHNGG